MFASGRWTTWEQYIDSLVGLPNSTSIEYRILRHRQFVLQPSSGPRPTQPGFAPEKDEQLQSCFTSVLGPGLSSHQKRTDRFHRVVCEPGLSQFVSIPSLQHLLRLQQQVWVCTSIFLFEEMGEMIPPLPPNVKDQSS